MSQQVDKMVRNLTNSPAQKRALKRIFNEMSPDAKYVVRTLYNQNRALIKEVARLQSRLESEASND